MTVTTNVQGQDAMGVQTRRRVRLLRLLLIAFAAAFSGVLVNAEESAVGARASAEGQVIRQAVGHVAASVVRIHVVGDPSGDGPVSSQVTSGLVITADGEILTSAFGFRRRPAAVFVETRDGKRFAARVVATDKVRKLVLLKCDDGDFSAIGPAANRWPPVGATAIAVGAFYSASAPAVSVGIVSAVRRIHGLAIQTDAKISPVNYGGPLIDADGNVMGLLVPLSPDDGEGVAAGVQWYDSGIGFCIPLEDAVRTAEKLRAGEDLVRGLMGIGLTTKNPLASVVEVSSVLPDSPAARADVKAKDVIVRANGQVIDRLGPFQSIIRSSYAGQKLKLVVRRGEEELRRELVLTDQLSVPEAGFLGVIPAGEVKSDDGTVVGVRIHVVPGTSAAGAGLPETAVVTRWDGDGMNSTADLTQKLKAVRQGEATELQFRDVVSSEDQSLVLNASKRPEGILAVPAAIVEQVSGLSAEATWRQSEEPIGKDGAGVWLYAPDSSKSIRSGVVVLLSAAGQSRETILRAWESHCRRHNLILVVPRTSERTELTIEHSSLVSDALRVVASSHALDGDRIVLVAEKGQLQLCESLLFNGRMRQVRAAVCVDCSPRGDVVTSDFLARKPLAVLMVQGRIQSRQAAAIQNQAYRRLSESGVFVRRVASKESSVDFVPAQISMWAWNLKIR